MSMTTSKVVHKHLVDSSQTNIVPNKKSDYTQYIKCIYFLTITMCLITASLSFMTKIIMPNRTYGMNYQQNYKKCTKRMSTLHHPVTKVIVQLKLPSLQLILTKYIHKNVFTVLPISVSLRSSYVQVPGTVPEFDSLVLFSPRG